jgi:hypothetical protein
LVIWHVLLKVPDHRIKRLVVYRHMVRVHPKDLGPALSTSIFEVAFDVGKGQVDLGVDFLFEFARSGVPAAYG